MVDSAHQQVRQSSFSAPMLKNMIRLSVGIEDVDLRADLRRALDAI
jgi:O-acetylhomoserine/O-acetylserine sulfhydrylase-like pyridoxal-dependent enzyme